MKRGQVHVASGFDIIILLFGVVLGVALVIYAVRNGYVPIDLITGIAQVAP